MKRHRFRLGSVMRYYELQKQRSELELQRASKILHDTDAEIERLLVDIASVSVLMRSEQAAKFTTAGWIACNRRTEQLGQWLTTARQRRIAEAAAVAKAAEVRKKWSIAEETLKSLKHEVDVFNRAEADRNQQEMLDESVLRQWITKESD
jgi:hypothetical protein